MRTGIRTPMRSSAIACSAWAGRRISRWPREGWRRWWTNTRTRAVRSADRRRRGFPRADLNERGELPLQGIVGACRSALAVGRPFPKTIDLEAGTHAEVDEIGRAVRVLVRRRAHLHPAELPRRIADGHGSIAEVGLLRSPSAAV